ncbi:MAG: ASCH/PUA domain-containing protein [Sphaerochaetaceae bacterium]
MEHILKIRSIYFNDVLSGLKPFEIRKDDRNYQTGDTLTMLEVSDDGKETGSVVSVKVTYLLHGPAYGLQAGYCIMGIKRRGKQHRVNSGNHPKDVVEIIQYSESLGRPEPLARSFFDYYTMTGWKMKNGLPLADWKAAFRRWKDYGSSPETQQTGDELSDIKIRLLLPLLLKKIAYVSDHYESMVFKEHAIGTIVKYYGLYRIKKGFNDFQTKELVGLYKESKKLSDGTIEISGNQYCKGKIDVPTLKEWSDTLQKKH